MGMNCSNSMYQSKEYCPDHCQWLGGKINRCQNKRKKTAPVKLSKSVKRSLKLAEKQPRQKTIKPKTISPSVKAVTKPKTTSGKKKTRKDLPIDCYEYTKEDKQWRKDGGKTGRKFTRTEKDMCEKHGHTFTKGNNIDYPNCGNCWCCKNHQGGGFYDKIVNPLTKKKVSINSKLGKSILQNYVNILY